MTTKEKKKWMEKLKPYWASREVFYNTFKRKEREIEKRMKKDLGEDLEFFYTEEGSCVGIGHADYNRRKKGKNYFPLFQDIEL